MRLPQPRFCRGAALARVSRASKSTRYSQTAASSTRPEFTSGVSPRPLIRLMPLGGSITHGVGSSDQNGYRKTLLKLLHERDFNVRMVGSRKSGAFINNEHEGWRGFRIDQIETRARLSAEKLSPHLFTVNAGSNDCLQCHNLAEASKRLEHLLQTLWKASPGSTIVLSSLLVNQDEGMDLRVREFNEEVENLSRGLLRGGQKIVFVDMHGIEGPQVEDLGDDGTHPNDAGYTKMANIWLKGIQAAADRGFLG